MMYPFPLVLVLAIIVEGFLFIRYNTQIQDYYTQRQSASPDTLALDQTQANTPFVRDTDTQQNGGGVTGEEMGGSERGAGG